MPKAAVDTPLTDKEIRFCHLLLAGEMTDRQCAEAAGLKASTADYVKAKPKVKHYMQEYRQIVKAAVAKHEAKVIIKFEITTPQLLERLWSIANLSPEETRGSMSAQVLAIKELLAHVADKPGVDEDRSAEPEIYQAAWLREREQGIFSEHQHQEKIEPHSTPPQPTPARRAPTPPVIYAEEPEDDLSDFTPEPVPVATRRSGVPMGAYW